MNESPCVRCGRCVDVCPTGAIYMEENINKMLFYTHSYETKTIAMASSTVLSDLEALNKMPAGSIDMHQLNAAFKKLGVDVVISEEQALNESMLAGEKLIVNAEGPVIISNSFAVKNFAAEYFAELAGRILYYPSVQESFAEITKKHAEKSGFDPEIVKTIVFTGNNENGAVAKEEGTVDISRNTREIYRTFLRSGVNLKLMGSSDALKFDTDPDVVFGKAVGPVAFNYQKDPEIIKIDGKCIAIAHNLGQAGKLLEEVQAGNSKYDIIRLQA